MLHIAKAMVAGYIDLTCYLSSFSYNQVLLKICEVFDLRRSPSET
jgi:hypothetical protein